MIPDLLTNLEIQKYGQNEPRFNDVYLRDNSLDKIKDGTYVIDLDQYANIGSDWIALYTKDNNFFFLANLESNTFQKKSRSLSMDLQLSQIFLEYKYMIQ